MSTAAVSYFEQNKKFEYCFIH